MVISESMQFNQNTSDNLNPADTIIPLMKKSDETLRLVEGATIISQNTIGHSFILGHPTNGILGVANGVDGQQIVLGEAGRATTTIRVVNPNNRFTEFFRTTTFKDTNSPNTANWDTTNFRLSMSSLSDHFTIYNTIATTLSIYLNLTTVSWVKFSSSEHKWNDTDAITYWASADGGNNWEQCTKDEKHYLTYTGQDLRGRIIFIGQGGSSTWIEDLQIEYG